MAAFEAFVDAADEPELLLRHRRDGLARYTELPMPTRKSEEWRYTDLSGLEPERFQPIAPEARRQMDREDLPEAIRAVLGTAQRRSAIFVEIDATPVYQQLDPELDAAGVVYLPIGEAARSRPALLGRFLFASDVPAMEAKLWALHVALLSNGYLLYIPRDVVIPHPVHTLRYFGRGGTVLSWHSLIVAEAGAEVTCVDEYLSPDLKDTSLSLAGTEIFGGDSSTVRYLSLQRYGARVKHFAMQHATARRDSRLSGVNVTLGGDLSRADVTSRLVGPGSESEMLALWFGDRDQHFDHHTLQHHAAPHARSDLLYKGALTAAARSVFRGLIRVDKGAQLTDAYQTNRNLLLSNESHATTLPNLEIEADDVRCSHGATVGQVDEGQLFYLMSRGLSRPQAERLLVSGFFHEVLSRVPVEGVRERIRLAIQEKIGI